MKAFIAIIIIYFTFTTNLNSQIVVDLSKSYDWANGYFKHEHKVLYNTAKPINMETLRYVTDTQEFQALYLIVELDTSFGEFIYKTFIHSFNIDGSRHMKFEFLSINFKANTPITFSTLKTILNDEELSNLIFQPQSTIEISTQYNLSSSNIKSIFELEQLTINANSFVINTDTIFNTATKSVDLITKKLKFVNDRLIIENIEGLYITTNHIEKIGVGKGNCSFKRLKSLSTSYKVFNLLCKNILKDDGLDSLEWLGLLNPDSKRKTLVDLKYTPNVKELSINDDNSILKSCVLKNVSPTANVFFNASKLKNITVCSNSGIFNTIRLLNSGKLIFNSEIKNAHVSVNQLFLYENPKRIQSNNPIHINYVICASDVDRFLHIVDKDKIGIGKIFFFLSEVKDSYKVSEKLIKSSSDTIVINTHNASERNVTPCVVKDSKKKHTFYLRREECDKINEIVTRIALNKILIVE